MGKLDTYQEACGTLRALFQDMDNVVSPWLQTIAFASVSVFEQGMWEEPKGTVRLKFGLTGTTNDCGVFGIVAAHLLLRDREPSNWRPVRLQGETGAIKSMRLRQALVLQFFTKDYVL